MDLREVTEFLRDSASYLISIGILLFVVIFIVAFQPIAGNSMAPTLEDGQITLVTRFTYKISKPRRNEIIVLKKDKKSYVKRVVGLPGEKIDYLNGILYIDDKPYRETFLDEKIVTYNFLFEDICSKEDCPDEKIPEGKYFVMGDNRPESMDSRDKTFGLVDLSEIKGKVFLRIYPFGQVR